jgi:hypothetical protein
MSDNEYADSSNPDGSLLHSSDSKEPKFACSTNKHVVGVAALTPVAWSSDGAWFVHATGDNSLHVCSRPGASPTFKVHGVLVGHSETVTCMVTRNLLACISLVTNSMSSTGFSPHGADSSCLRCRRRTLVLECCRLQVGSTRFIFLLCSRTDLRAVL